MLPSQTGASYIIYEYQISYLGFHASYYIFDIFSFQTIRWCAKKANDLSFTGLAQTPIHSEASPSGCQYTRSSTITYNLTSADTFTRFLCESGDTGLCETGTAIQYVNISTTGKISLYIKYFSYNFFRNLIA